MYILYENETAVNVRLDVKAVRTHVSTFCATLRGGPRRRTRPHWWLSLGCVRDADTPDLGRWLLPGFAGAQVTPCGLSVTVSADGTLRGGSLCCRHSSVYLAYKGSACDEGTCSTIYTFKNWYDVTLKIVFGCTGK